MAGGFQTAVNTVPAPGIAGDFCTANPRYSAIAGPFGLVAGLAGLTVGRFAWISNASLDSDNAGDIANNFGTGPVGGFVPRLQQGLIINFLADATMVVPSGYPVTLFSACDVWVKNDGATTALVGQKAYANFADGRATFAAPASPLGATGTASSIAANTNSFTGSIANNVLTVTAIGAGVVVPGTSISGTGIAAGTIISSQLTGTAGGIGTYAVNIAEQTVASTAISGTYGTLTVGGTVTGVFGVGDTLTGSGVVVGTAITALGTGTGGAGTYIVNNNTVVASTTITAALNVETSWYCRSPGLAGELVKVSNVPGLG
jgi:hypothetical protein